MTEIHVQTSVDEFHNWVFLQSAVHIPMVKLYKLTPSLCCKFPVIIAVLGITCQAAL